MKHTWVGRSGWWVQVGMMIGILCALYFMILLWLVLLYPIGDQRLPLVVFILLQLAIIAGVGLCVWAAGLYRPVRLVIDDDGLCVGRNSRKWCIRFCEVSQVSFVTGWSAAGGIILFPTPEFLERNGGGRPGKASLKWTIPSLAFSSKQLEEIEPIISERVLSAGGESLSGIV